MSQLVDAEVSSGNRKAILASNYAKRIRGRHAALRLSTNIDQVVAQVKKSISFIFCS